MAHRADRPSGSTDTVTNGRARPGESGVVVPKRCTLDGFTAEVVCTDGVYLRDLDPITTLRVQTENTRYEVTVPRLMRRRPGSAPTWLANVVCGRSAQ